MAAEQALKRAGAALGLALPRRLSSALTLAVLEQCAAAWFFPALCCPEMMGRWALAGAGAGYGPARLSCGWNGSTGRAR
jgi:hypothetical protein